MNSRYKKLLFACTASLLMLISACGNPFSGNDNRKNPLPNYHTKNTGCNEVDLSEEHLTTAQLRSVVRCLNSNHEFEAVNALLDSLSDAELEPVSSLVNETSDLNPRMFYALKEMYRRLQKSGKHATLEDFVSELFSNAENNKKIADTLNILAPDLRRLIFDSKVSLNLKNISALTASPAFKRVMNEADPEFLRKLIAGLKTYSSNADHTSLAGLYLLLDRNSVGTAFYSLLKSNGKEHLQNLSSFIEWMFDTERFSTLAKSVRAMHKKDVVCLKDNIKIPQPFSTGLERLRKMSAREAKQFFKHDLKNLVLTGQGYCEFPYALNPLLHFLSDAADQNGFEEMFAVLKPMMTDPQFIHFISSTAVERWVKDNAFLLEKHAIVDLLTLVLHDERMVVSNNGLALAGFLDAVFTRLSVNQGVDLFRSLAPVFSEKHKYGHEFFTLLAEIQDEFPTLELKYKKEHSKALAPLFESVLKKPEVANVLSLTSTLIKNKKLDQILEDTLKLFRHFLERGQFEIQYGKITSLRFGKEDSYHWKLSRLTPTLKTADGCDLLDYDWSFTRYSPSEKTTYLRQLELIRKCVDANQTFKSAIDFALYAIPHESFGYILDFQKDVLSEIFRLDPELSLDTVYAFLGVSRAQSHNLRQKLALASRTASLTQAEIRKMSAVRAELAKQVKNPDLFSSLAEITRAKDIVLPKVKPRLDLMALSSIKTFVSKDQTLPNENFASAVSILFEKYCPSLDIKNRDCDIDDDQVNSFRTSPDKLVAEIKKEYLSSSQAWLHPLQMREWKRPLGAAQPATEVAEFNYHYRPLLHLLRNGKNAAESIFAAIDRLQYDRIDLHDFLAERSTKLLLIPYVYQVPNYPESTKREFHTRIRLRIVSDLDRLELIAINTDFKAFGLTKNFGLGFIRDIGLSWGDEPAARRPKDLSKFVSEKNIKTLSETRHLIHQTLDRFDRNIVQKLGECDSRGKSRFGRWLQSQLCSAEIFDLSARLFNVRSLISLIDEELPEKDGGAGGMLFLRDLFYGLYSLNLPNELERFPNGQDIDRRCLVSPSQFNEPIEACAYDLLTLISRMTRLGLIHQASLNAMNNNESSLAEFTALIERLAKEKGLRDRLTDLTPTKAGTSFLESTADFGFTSDSNISQPLISFAQTASRLDSLNWLNLLTDLGEQYPDFLTDFQKLIELGLIEAQPALLKIEKLTRQDSKTKTWLNSFASQSNSTANHELAVLLKSLLPQVEKLTVLANQGIALPEFDDPAFKKTTADWFETLALPRSETSRRKISSWIVGSDFDRFCAVYSDPETVDKAYLFLEQINQNPDSKKFIESIEDFLKLR